MASLSTASLGVNVSHHMDMYVWNRSGGELRSYSVTHTWNDITDKLSGANLPDGEYSPSQVVTTGYTEHDYYTVEVTFVNGQSKGQHFYCDSSHSNDRVELEIYTGYLHCMYYDPDRKYDTSCKNKHWD